MTQLLQPTGRPNAFLVTGCAQQPERLIDALDELRKQTGQWRSVQTTPYVFDAQNRVEAYLLIVPPRSDKEEVAFEFKMPETSMELATSVHIPTALFDIIPKLSGSQTKILCYLMRHCALAKGKSVRISIAEFLSGKRDTDGCRLDRGAGVSRPTLCRDLRTLIGHDLITRKQLTGINGNDVSSEYRLSGELIGNN